MNTSGIVRIVGAAILGFAMTASGMPFGYFVLCCGFAVLGFYAGYNCY